MKKRIQVVLLPTNQKSQIRFDGNNKLIYHKNDLTGNKSQHLYFINNDKIKENDWVFDLVNNKILQSDHDVDYEQNPVKKVIASTDESLTHLFGYNLVEQSLPQPSQEFIQYYVEQYNKGNIIEWVDVEYEAMNTTIVDRTYNDYEPKINSDNTINISPIKDSFSREEVVKLLRKAFEAARMKNKAVDKIGYGSGYGSITGQKRKYKHETESWISENL